MLGFGCDMKKIMNISKKYKIKIIEDNCEALGGKIYKRILEHLEILEYLVLITVKILLLAKEEW